MSLKIALYCRFIRQFRLEQLKAPPILMQQEAEMIEILKNKIKKNINRYKVDKRSIEKIKRESDEEILKSLLNLS